MSNEVLYITILHFIHKNKKKIKIFIYGPPKDKFLALPLASSWKARHNTDNQCKYEHKDSMVYQGQYSGPW